MSKSEKIKEQIGWLKVIFGLLVATIISLIGWMATRYKDADASIMIVSMVVVIILAVAIVVVNMKAFDKINELEDL